MATDFPPATPPRRPQKLRAPYALNFSIPHSPASSLSPTSSVSSFRSSPTSSEYSSSPVTPASASSSSPLRAPLYHLADRFPLYSSDSVPDMFPRPNSVRSSRSDSSRSPAGIESTVSLGSLRHGRWDSKGNGDLDSLRRKDLPMSIRSHRSNSDDSSSMASSIRTRSSDDSTLADDASAFSFRSRAKLWAPWSPKKEKPSAVRLAPAVVLKSTADSDTEFEDDESDDDDDDLMMQPPDGWKPPKSFQSPELGVRNGSRQLRCGPWEVPYPISYDKVLMDADDQTHELVKALIPTRNCVSFYEFPKPPSTVLDIGCGAGRWVVEAAGQWKHARFVGLDLMAIQYDLSGRCFDDIRDRIHLHYQIPFAASTFDYIRMSHVALAIPTEHWKHVIYEIRRVLKPGGVVEWIDEDPVLPLSPNCASRGSERLERAANLEAEFKSLVHSRKLRKPATTVKKLLRGRALGMRTTHVTKIRLGLPTRDTRLLHQESESCGPIRSHQGSPLRVGKSSTDFFSLTDDEDKNPLPRSTKHYMPRGLVVLPEGKLLPLAPPDITAQATRNFQLVLGAAEAIWSRRLFYDPDANRAKFEQEIWEYERGGCSRVHLPAPTWDKLDNETPIAPLHPQQPSLSTLNHRRRAPLSLPSLLPSAGSRPTIGTTISSKRPESQPPSAAYLTKPRRTSSQYSSNTFTITLGRVIHSSAFLGLIICLTMASSNNMFIQAFTHLKTKPREKEALAYLQRVASLVKPIMRKHGWNLPVLAEFFPANASLLGLNINGGQKICIRLRPAFDESAFLEEHEVIGTMLHEVCYSFSPIKPLHHIDVLHQLTHNVHGPHDQKFYKLLSQLEDEFDALQRSGYAGEGFHSPGARLGQGVSHDLPLHLAKEKALAAAEKRRQAAIVMKGGGKLGGKSDAGKSIRQLAAEAAERRAKDEKTCGSGAEAQVEADRAARDGVEDDAQTIEDFEPNRPEAWGSPSITTAVLREVAAGAPPSSTSKKTRLSSGVAGPTQSPVPRRNFQISPRDTPAKPTIDPTCSACTFINPRTASNCEGSSAASSSPNRDAEDTGSGPRTGVTFEAWLSKIGSQFKDPLPGRPNWLGVTCPFPMNPSFKPRAPISDVQRQIIFDAHAEDQNLNSIRVLSERFGISLKRVEAIIRLKALEFEWKQGNRPLRTNFLMGMESALGVIPFKPSNATSITARSLNSNTHLADTAAEEDANSITEVQRGIPKMYWEGVEDGQEPLVAPLVASLADEHAQKVADSLAASAKFLASHQHVVPAKMEGRAPTVFVDVGTKFMIPKEERKRQKAAAARKKQKEKKRVKAKQKQ
ncbi:hypothetical protein FRB96_000324 [Tulasnella sp. 330]|nr:hypothetical protein FRB96_000324 [Tulasnella sp. 330]